MNIILTASFERDFKKLSGREKGRSCDIIPKLPKAVGKAHAHAGIGLRKIHPGGIFEARMGLGLRLVFAIRAGALVLHRIGSHEAIRKYLKDL